MRKQFIWHLFYRNARPQSLARPSQRTALMACSTVNVLVGASLVRIVFAL